MRPSKRSVQIVTASGILAWLTAAGAGILLTRSQAGTWAEMLVYSTIVPVLLAAFVFGRSGGLLAALFASLVAGSLAIGRPETLQSPIVQRVLLQVIFFNVVALVTSGLSEREKKAAQSYREMFDGVPTGLYRTTPKGQILDANPALAQMLGYPDQESLLAVNVSSMYVSPDARERKLALLESKGVIHGFEMQLYRYDGSVIWVRDSARAVCDADGEQRYYEGSLEDITAQIQAQEALRESETLLKTIFDGISDPMHVVDSGYRVVATNKKLLDLRGLVQEEIVGKPCYEVYQNRDTHCVECAAREAFATGRAAQVDKSLPMEDGSRRRFEVYAFPILTGDGNVDRVIELTRDVTERKQAEAEIARLATVVEQAAVTVVITDLEGDIVYANPDFETSTGYSVAEALGQNPRVLKSDRQDAPFYQELWDTITAGRTWRGVFINKRKDGELYHEDATIFPIKNTDGEIINYAAVKRNITERVRAQVQIAGLNRLRESLLRPDRLEKKLERITDGVVEIFQADFCRIWLTRPGDRCDDGCFHASVTEGPHVCRQRERCMHLVASSGRYTHIDGEVHRRVPFDCYKIGRVASGAESQFLTNDVTRDPRIHDPDWAGELGLVSFAGYRLLSDDGDPIGVLALFSQRAISPDEDGLLEGLANTAAQVIQTDKAEQALRESEARYRALFEQASDAIFLESENDEIIDVNRRACELLGYSRQELLTMMVTDLQAPEARGQEGHVIRNELAQYQGVPFESIDIHRDGTRIPVEISTSQVTGTKEGLILSIVRDITTRKRAEEERERLLAQIHEQAKRIQQTIDTVPEGVLLLDAHGQVVLANPVAEKDLRVLVGWDDVPTHEPITHLGDRPLAELLTSPPTKGLWHEVKAGARTFESIARPIENGPEPENWVLVINDVTQEREIKRRVQQQERLAAVGQLAAGVAHDFNNIMAIIVLYTQMSLSAPDLPSQIRQRLETVSGQAYRATDLVQQILDFSRLLVIMLTER
ncbi:MAG: hypothetical protein DRJ03_23545 [Chloroflexi bacterium]|nr:MAG: hypothetical protein DRJ03_23545 [Chloroflexota bacterium]